MNLLADLPDASGGEVVTPLLTRPGVRLERIVSAGQATPAETPYDQSEDEWVTLLAGEAGLWIDGEGERRLVAGDTVMLPARTRHRVTWTSTDPPAVWLALHLG